jgi:very-short-patch-repair endonuclease
MPTSSKRPDRARRSAALGEIARGQYGVFTRRQALDVGHLRSAIDWRVRTGEWESTDFGVYRTAGTPASWHQRLLSACLAGPAVASHRSAAVLWRFPGFDDSVVEVTAIRHRRRFASDVVWHESIRLGDDQHTVLDGVPTTSATRTIIDLGAVCDASAIIAAFDDAARRSLTSAGRVAAAMESLGPTRRGSGTLRRALAQRLQADPVPESILETRFAELVRDAGLPTPVRQHRVADGSGQIVARVDFAYPRARLAIEIDGAQFHAGASAWRGDLARQNVLVALGWQVLRFTARDLDTRPDEIATTIRSTLRLHVALLNCE